MATTIPATVRPVTAATPPSAPAPAQPQLYRPEEYSIATVVMKFFEEKSKDIAKALGYTAFWVGEAIPNLPPQVQTFNGYMRDFKNFVGATEVPKKVEELKGALDKLWSKATEADVCDKFYESCRTKGVWTTLTEKADRPQDVGVCETVREVIKKTGFLINSTMDGVDFAHRFVPIDHTAMTCLSGVNFGATVVGSGVGAIENASNIAEHISEPDESATKLRTLKMLHLARDVSYATLGVIGLYFVITATAFVPWMIVACLTSGLACTIGSYFYEKLYDPENKGKNLNINNDKVQQSIRNFGPQLRTA